MDCKELIDLFTKVGGSLICNYEEKKVIVIGTNLKCNIKPEDHKELNKLERVFSYSPYNLTYIKNDKISDNSIINYLINDKMGFRIDYIDFY